MQYVLVVGADNMVAQRTIQPGATVGALVVLDGVKPGERVIVEGMQKARPGSRVNPTMAAADPAKQAGEKARKRRPKQAKPGGK